MDEEKSVNPLYIAALEDFFQKFPDSLNYYDFWIRLAQTSIEFSDENKVVKNLSLEVGNAIVKVLDSHNKPIENNNIYLPEK